MQSKLSVSTTKGGGGGSGSNLMMTMMSSSSSPSSVVAAVASKSSVSFIHNYCSSSTTIRCSSSSSPSGSDHQRFPFNNNKNKLKLLNHHLDSYVSDDVRQRVSTWIYKTQNFLSEVTSPLVKKTAQGRRNPDPNDDDDDDDGGNDDATNTLLQDMDDIFVSEQTINRTTPNGSLSLAAAISVEQFSRMNGLTGQKMQNIFRALVPGNVYNDARNLVEYCCFRFLSRDTSSVHPSLKEPAFQKLMFITMLAWQNPYCEGLATNSEKVSFQTKLVGEEAFVRIAPAISGVADRSTVHNLFKALGGKERGISLSLWLTYMDELLKVHEGRKSYQSRELLNSSGERILCIGSSRKPPILRWENNFAWPGKITLTDRAFYFEAVGLRGQKDARRIDLTKRDVKVEKAKVGPLGSNLFESAISISSDPNSEPLVLEFVDLGGEMRRDVWHAFLSEVIALHKFIYDYGPEDGDESVLYVYGAQKGKERAIVSAINGIARLQTLQYMRKLLDDPIKLVQYSYLQKAPYGEVVYQTLALNYWGGPLITRAPVAGLPQRTVPSGKIVEGSNNVVDLDGSVYLQKWMRCSSWTSSASINFWKNAIISKGVVLSKNLVVADKTLLQRAAETCREKFQMVEKTQATIDAAMIKGIPSNIDLFKELMLPFTVAANFFEKLRCWEYPLLTVSFLTCAYTAIFRNLLSYVFPTALVFLSAFMLTLKVLKGQGRLGRSFGQVTIRDQPPSNTIEKIIALKDAMRDMENYLQNLNVTLLKMRTIMLSGQPQVTTEVALSLLAAATILLIVPFKYVFAFVLFDLFTRELEFRRDMVRRFMSFLKERWNMVPATPVVVLPFEDNDIKSTGRREETEGQKGSEKRQSSSK